MNDLSWDSHTNKLIGSLRHCYRSFSRSCKWLTVDSRKLLYNAAIASRINYCDAIWDKCKQDTVKKLQTIQNRCARRILEASPGASAGPLLRELGWLTLQEKRKLHKCVLVHGLMQGKGPHALCSELDKLRTTSAIGTRATTGECLSLKSHRTNYVAKSFFYDAAKLWNKIPQSIRQTKNRSTFKEKLHHYFLNM